MNETLNITHLFPDHLNVYGDIGNIITLTMRSKRRGIGVKITSVGLDDPLPENTDIYFIGGGEDEDQELVFPKLLQFKTKLIDDVEMGKVVLSICGGYQLFGKYFLAGNGKRIEGLGILDVETKAPSLDVKVRCIGNVIQEINPELNLNLMPNTLVGFENHSGQTYLGENVKPLGYVRLGFGNNVNDQTEGAVYKNVFGTYLHGSLLPKNPHFADFLIQTAMQNNLGKEYNLEALDNSEEILAHNAIIKRFL